MFLGVFFVFRGYGFRKSFIWGYLCLFELRWWLGFREKAISLGVDGDVYRAYRGCCGENALIYPKVEAFMREELERKGVGSEQRRITFFGQLRDIFVGQGWKVVQGSPI